MAILLLAISAILFIFANPRDDIRDDDDDADDEARENVQEAPEAAAPTMAGAIADIFIVLDCDL